MKNIYVTSGMVQSRMIESYLSFGEKKNFINIVRAMYEKGEYVTTKPELPLKYLWGSLPDDEFIDLLYKLPIHLNKIIQTESNSYVVEDDILPADSDVFVFKHFNFIFNSYHMQNYFEVGYVFKGSCKLKFEKEEHFLGEGELFIVAPMSLHDIIIDDNNSVVIIISIRKSTFENSFFTLISQQDLLSYFFRTILYNQVSSNYLLFSTDNSVDIKTIIKNLVMENYKDDIYFNNCCISWVNILFSNILRNYSDTIRFYNYNTGNTNFPIILQYIQSNYKSLTLKSLADFFHYSEAHLSTLIKKNTGLKFTEIVNNLKMSNALEYLKNTTLPLTDIAEYVGYNSVDYFSRTFKKYHRKSPQQYRNQLNRQNP